MDKDHLTLQWEPPEDDGKSPITEYIVERREKSEKTWNVVGTTPADGKGVHCLTDNKVVEGKEYYYRVRAVNRAGPGDPCDHGKSVKIKAKPGWTSTHLCVPFVHILRRFVVVKIRPSSALTFGLRNTS